MTLAANAQKVSKKGHDMTDWDPDQVPIIRFKGVFDWQGLYRLARMWFESNNYKFNEKRYKHKGDEVEVDMYGERKIDEMIKYDVYVHFHIWHLRDIEVVEGTRTLKRNQGIIHIEIHSTLKLDWQGRFSQGRFNQMLYKWWKVVKKREIEAKFIEPLTFDMYRLHTDIKTFLNMSTDANYYG